MDRLQTSWTGYKLHGQATNFMDRLQASWTGYKLHEQATSFMNRLQTSWTGYKRHGQATNIMDRLQTSWMQYKLHEQATNFMNRLQTSWMGYKLHEQATNFMEGLGHPELWTWSKSSGRHPILSPFERIKWELVWRVWAFKLDRWNQNARFNYVIFFLYLWVAKMQVCADL